MERILNTIFNHRHKTVIILDLQKQIMRFSFIGYILFLLYKLLLEPQRLLTREILIANRDIYFNLIPFKTISRYFQYFSYFKLWDWISNIFGNVFLFIPFGLMIPFMIKSRYKLPFTVGLGFFMVLNIELIQHYFGLGVFDVDDIILNIFGIIMGFIGYKSIERVTNSKL